MRRAGVEWVVGHGAGIGLGRRLPSELFPLHGERRPKVECVDGQRRWSLKQAAATTGAEVDSTNSDLSRFAARGSKLIMYHGWNDQRSRHGTAFIITRA